MAYRDLMHEIQIGDNFESGNDDEMFSILTSSSAHSSEADFFDIKSTLTNYINQINNNTQTVHQYTDKYIISTSKEEYQEITQKIDHIISNNNSISTQIRTIINTEKNKIIATENNVQNLQVVEFNNTVQNFKVSTQNFQAALNSFDNSVKDKQMRQIYVLRGSIDEKEMEQLEELNYEQRQQWIEKQYVLTDDKTLQRLIDLEEQRDGMLKIEKSINELKVYILCCVCVCFYVVLCVYILSLFWFFGFVDANI